MASKNFSHWLWLPLQGFQETSGIVRLLNGKAAAICSEGGEGGPTSEKNGEIDTGIDANIGFF